MIYYIDTQPVRKKTRFSLKKLSAFAYIAALILSACAALPFILNNDIVYSIPVSSTEFADSGTITTSETDVVEDVFAPTFSGFSSPLDSAYISSHFGYRTNPVSGKYKHHNGLDLACGEGSSIYAVLDGVVTVSKYSESYGNYIIIDHKNGFQTLYAHCSKLLKSCGDIVSCGDVIALVGSTGYSTGPHLHIEIRSDGERIDPELYFGKYFQ